MKLTYRGIQYDYEAPSVEYGDTVASGKYRGLDIRFRNPKKKPVYPATLDLRYRGVNAGVAAAETVPAPEPQATQPTLATAVASTVDSLARNLMLDQSRSIKRRQQDMLSRLANEVGVPAEEIERDWSKIQGKLHPSFRTSYGRSGAAMS
ncbi:MAG: DUF4278 domain-containing protein [Leptolyngbyaceae bacterium]|nr:DUF4278 domain-containing protein [Leptolyngbyaceae bacterium]